MYTSNQFTKLTITNNTSSDSYFEFDCGVTDPLMVYVGNTTVYYWIYGEIATSYSGCRFNYNNNTKNAGFITISGSIVTLRDFDIGRTADVYVISR